MVELPLKKDELPEQIAELKELMTETKERIEMMLKLMDEMDRRVG